MKKQVRYTEALYRDVIVDESYCVNGGKLFGKSSVYDERDRNGLQIGVNGYSVDTDIGDTVTKNNISNRIEFNFFRL